MRTKHKNRRVSSCNTKKENNMNTNYIVTPVGFPGLAKPVTAASPRAARRHYLGQFSHTSFRGSDLIVEVFDGSIERAEVIIEERDWKALREMSVK